MIDIVIDRRCATKLRRELRCAGTNEIGGVLAGEQLSEGVFQICDLSVQRTGSFASFTRSSALHRRFIERFHERTGRDYQRYNYLGEWHSHPSFPAVPSHSDVSQMQRLIEEPTQEAGFLVLLVVKLNREGCLEGSAHAFRRRLPCVRGRLISGEQLLYKSQATRSRKLIEARGRL